MFRKALRMHAVLVYAAARLWAQGLTGPVMVKGEIDAAGKQVPVPLTVELVASGHSLRFGHELVSPDGSFAFQDVPPGPPGALDHLEKSAVEFPNAYLIAARILVRHGEPSRAATQLRDYLAASPQASNREQIQSWLSALGY